MNLIEVLSGPPAKGPFPILAIFATRDQWRGHTAVQGWADTHGDAVIALASIAVSWEKSKKGRTFKRVGNYEYWLYYTDGKTRAYVFAEVIPYDIKLGDGVAS